MIFELNPEQRAFRDELCAFLSSELSPETYGKYYDENAYGGWNFEYWRILRKKLGERGYIGLNWPKEYGGEGKDTVYQVILADEVEYHGAPGLDASLTYLPQALIAFGTDEQKRFFLPQLRRGELFIFLGYSEPEAGSDLANLSTRAVAEGDHFILTGQKVYSSHANVADYGIVAARTDPHSERHSGISLFWVDMKSPGISLAEQKSIAGWKHHSVYFDHVAVPRSMMCGPLHEGWRVLMGALDYERAGIGAPGKIKRQLDRLITYVHTPNESGTRPIDDPVVQDKLVSLAVDVEASQIYAYHLAERQSRGERPQHETSLSILLKREVSRLADYTGMELLGPYSQLHGQTPYAPFDGRIEHEYREHIYFHFAAGGFDITRNVLALRGLKLPR